MRRVGLVLLSVLFSMLVNAQLRWDGGAGDGFWSSAANWDGDMVPGPGDDVLLDNSFLAEDYTVNFSAGNTSVSVRSLYITPASPYTIILLNPVSNISATAFRATGAGDAVVLNARAVFKNSSGAASGTPVAVSGSSFFRINNGGRYIHNTARGHTTELVSRLSTAAGTEDGIFEFDVPTTAAYTVSASNRIYGHLIFSAAAAGAVKTYTASGTGLFTIRGKLEIRTNAVLSYGANTNRIIVSKDCFIGTGAVFNISNGGNNSTVSLKGMLVNQGTITESGSSTGSGLEFSGSANQDINSTGLFLNTITTIIDNPAGISLLSPLHIPFHLRLSSGKIRTNLSNILVMNDNAVYTGGSDNSFVEGPMRKKGDDDFNFPIGIGNIFAPVGIEGSGGTTTDEFTAAYHRNNPQSTPGLGNNYQDPIHHISYTEYWTIARDAGVSDRTVRLNVSPYSFGKVLNTMLVARFESGQWISEGGSDFISGPAVPPYITGSFQTAAPVSEFGAFTIATTDEETENPLPVRLISFEAVKQNAQTILNWSLSESSTAARFEIEKAKEDRRFQRIGHVNGHTGNPSYHFRDSALENGIFYYRLRIIDRDSIISFSPVTKIINLPDNLSVKMSPTVVSSSATISFKTGFAQSGDIVFINMAGRVVKKRSVKLQAGHSDISLSLDDLSYGVYQLVVVTAMGKTETIRFIKR